MKLLASTITLISLLLFRQKQTYQDKCMFFTDINTVWVLQSNKSVIDAMNGLNKQTKAALSHNINF